jgi:hypothetical protein
MERTHAIPELEMNADHRSCQRSRIHEIAM